LKGLPRARVYRLIRRGEVRVNKKRAKPETKLVLGDVVRVPPYMGKSVSEPGKPSPQLAARLQACLLHEDDYLLVLNKPSGLAVHGGSGIKLGLVEALRQLEPRWKDLELVHRLDRETSGCLLLAKTAEALKPLQGLFKSRQIEKIYHALVWGQWPEAVSEVDLPLLRDQLPSGERRVRVAADGKAALTRFAVLERFAGVTLLEAAPETGRTHQIRVHCAAQACPIVGDPRYGEEQAADLALEDRGRLKAAGLCLHASRLSFAHPLTGAPLSVTADYQPALHELLAALSKAGKSSKNTAT
jgi:23S rRNA pseudouridine955/2504/2580 synthase